MAYTLEKWSAGLVAAEAELVVDELVRDAVTATGVMEEREHWTELTRIEFITVRLVGLEASVRIEVWDSSPARPALPDGDNAHIRRGSYSVAGGKVVWAELPLLSSRSGLVASIHLPLPEELRRPHTDPKLLRRVRDGLDSL